MKIFGIYNIANTKSEDFNRVLTNVINKLQADGQVVEVQYSTNIFNNGQICFSALILGRKD